MKYANHIGYSDVNPYEIVKEISPKTLEIRSMSAERDPKFYPEFVSGGFFGTVINQDNQKWIIKSNPNSPIFRIRLNKSGWKDSSGNKYQLSDNPIKYYDFNF